MGTLCDEVQRLGKGIGNAARYSILEALLEGSKTVGELVTIIRLSQPAVSQHLKVLKSCNLVLDERRGQEVWYAVNAAYMLKVITALSKDVKKCK